MISSFDRTELLTETSRTKTNLVYYQPNTFILHFKSITWKKNLVTNGIFIITFTKRTIKNINLLTKTSKFSEISGYHVHNHHLFIFQYNARSKYIFCVTKGQQSIEVINLKSKLHREIKLNFVFRVKPSFVSLNENFFLIMGFKPSVGMYSIILLT
jgi:hypothetical protein